MITNQTTTEEAAGLIAGDCLAMRVRLLNRRITSVYDEAFRPLGMTASQVTILVAIIKRNGMAAVELGQLLSIEKSTLSRNLKRMQKAGWIKIESTGREQRITVSTSGRSILRKAFPRWEEAQRASRKLLGHHEARTFKDMVDAVRSKESKGE